MSNISQILKDIMRAGRDYRERNLEPLGLSAQQGLLLREIEQSPGISQEQLVQRIRINKSNVARQAAILEEEGYIARKPCGKDKRVLRLYLTEKAQAVLPRIRQVMDSWDDRLVENLTEKQQQTLEKLLLRVRDGIASAEKEGSE